MRTCRVGPLCWECLLSAVTWKQYFFFLLWRAHSWRPPHLHMVRVRGKGPRPDNLERFFWNPCHLSHESRKCNISFYLVGGREREFISERKIYQQIFYIYIFNFLLKNTFRYCLAFWALATVAFATALKENLQVLIKNKTVLLKAFFNLGVILVKILLLPLLQVLCKLTTVLTTCLEGTRYLLFLSCFLLNGGPSWFYHCPVFLPISWSPHTSKVTSWSPVRSKKWPF